MSRGTLSLLVLAAVFSVAVDGVHGATLYAVSGDGATIDESLFTLSQTDGSETFVTALGNGDDGESIAYNPNDGLIYHWSGNGNFNIDEVMETIDPNTLAINSVVLSGDEYDEVLAATFDPTSGGFLIADLNDELFQVTTGGVVSLLGEIPDSTGFDTTAVKGLAFVGPTLFALEHFDEFDDDDELDLLAIDPSNGDVLMDIHVSLAGFNLNGGSNGLALNPDTGELWGIVQTETIQGGERQLVTIDPTTGVATHVGTLNDGFAGITFIPDPINAIPEPLTATLGVMVLAAMGVATRRRMA